MTPFRTAVLLLLLAAAPAAAQPKTGEVQPDRIDVGTVYTGAVVEASFLVFEAGNNPNLPLAVTAPKFVKVLRTSTHAQQFGPGNDYICGTVELVIDTKAAGTHKGEVQVTLGATTVKVPVSATVQKRRAGLVRLLVAETAFERYTTGDGKLFRAWTDLAKAASIDPSYLLVTRGKPVLRDLDLRKFDCVLLSGTGLVDLTPADVKKVRAFAEAGGRVVVGANAFYRGTVKGANKVLDGYGLEIRDQEERSGNRDGVTIGKDGIDARAVKAGVASAYFYRASPVAVTIAGRVVVKAVGVGQPGDGFVAVAKAGKGQVIALGESLWWHWISKEQAKKTDNAKLLRFLLAPPEDTDPPGGAP
jgi:hypothetical protein